MSRPDLLHEKLPLQEEARGFSEALTFGFARGVEQGHLLKLTAPPLAETSFRRSSFANDLFLNELIRGSFPVISSEGKVASSPDYFLRVLSSPPKSHEDIAFRQNIFKELSSDPQRWHLLKEAHGQLRDFCDAFCGADHISAPSVGVKRRIDILIAYRDALHALTSLGEKSSSGLVRVAGWAKEIQGRENYLQLQHLLSFEDTRATIDARLQVGYDGELRRLTIVSLSHSSHSAFPRSHILRFFKRVISLLKGYRFSEEDVMSQLLDRVFSNIEKDVYYLLGVYQQIEFYLRGMAFYSQSNKRGQDICLPKVLPLAGVAKQRRLEGLFNPWLLAQGVSAIPCDLMCDDAHHVTIVSGPNSGGKTRLLQSLAITQLLAQGGLFVPAKVAVLPQVEQLFLSLLEKSEAEQDEGRLGVELMRVREVFEQSGPRSLVLMDELCSGTNPSEGEQIFDMVLGLFDELRPQVFITTHFLDFAHRIAQENRPRLKFLQVEIDERQLPTYQFLPGVAQTSLARNTATRLGVTRDELMRLIHKHQRLS